MRHQFLALKFLVFVCLPFWGAEALGQNLTVTNIAGTTSADGQALVNVIKGTGIQSFSNVTLTAYVGPGTTKATSSTTSNSSSAGTFTGGQGILGINSGIILSTGGGI